MLLGYTLRVVVCVMKVVVWTWDYSIFMGVFVLEGCREIILRINNTWHLLIVILPS